ncbi:asparaginase [Candidatus Berkelbacteria bacterium]|nr:asparaginase [Candidatus Berkelbacteria bacterium]
MKHDVIHVVITGGTIDSYYNGTKDTVMPLEHSALPAFLQSMKLYEQLEFTEVCMKDSREMTQSDLDNIVKTIEDSPHTKILVTHGTYTMPDTAKYLDSNLKRKDQTIVFTGSLIPLTGFSPSDASFNLGFSLAKIQELGPGISVCMNGRIFTPQEVAKLLYEGRFISVFASK